MSNSNSTSSIPGPPPMPLLGWRGNILSFALDPVAFTERLHRQYGDIVAVTRGSTKHVFVFTPAYNHQILSDTDLFHVFEMPFEVPPGSSLSRLLTIPGQMNSTDNVQQRRVMLTTLGRKMYTRYQHHLVDMVTDWLNSWQIGEEREIFQELIQLATAVPCRAIFDLDPQGNGRKIVDLLHEWGDALLAFSTRVISFDLPGSSYRRFLRSSEKLEVAYRDLIAQYRMKGDVGGDTLRLLVDLHDSDPEELSEDQLLGQINNLFNAGNTSRAAIIAWTVFLLAQHPPYLSEIQEELEQVLNGRSPGLDDLRQLTHLHAALQESMRLLPPMTWMPREATAPTQLGPYAIPAGSVVMCSPFVTQRQPDIYPQPDQFRPHRWQEAKPSAYEYLAFGAGARMCPGRDLATLEMMTVLAMILQRYQLVPVPHKAIDRVGVMPATPRRMPMRIQSPYISYVVRPCKGNINRWLKLDTYIGAMKT